MSIVCKRHGCKRPTKAHGLCHPDYMAGLRRRGKTLRPTQSDWCITSDGIVDDVAVCIAASGERLVRLTPTEQLSAARLILESGGDVHDLQARLGINHTTALALIRAFQRRFTDLDGDRR